LAASTLAGVTGFGDAAVAKEIISLHAPFAGKRQFGHP
jgi:hypothetical protein